MGHHEKLALKFYFIVDMLTTLFVYFTQNMMPLHFSIIRVTMEKQAYHKLPFLDVLVRCSFLFTALWMIILGNAEHPNK